MPAPETSGRLINVLIGCIDLTRPPNRLASVLGSCIGLAMFDAEQRLAGLAHILLPDSRGTDHAATPGKHADRAVPALAAALVAHGATRARLRAKLAGGARMFGRVSAAGADVGSANIAAVRAALAAADIPLVAADVGGNRGRKVVFDPGTAALAVETLDNRSDL